MQRALIGGRERVPTLAGLVEAFPQARFNIDIKSDGAVRALATYVEEQGLHDRVLVGSFSPSRLYEFRRLTRGRVATAGHPGEVVAVRFLPALVARVLTRRGRPAALQVPHRRGRLTVVSRGFIRRAHALGMHVHVWTIDEPAEIDLLLDRGVDGIFTDRTDILRDVLRSRGQWREAR